METAARFFPIRGNSIRNSRALTKTTDSIASEHPSPARLVPADYHKKHFELFRKSKTAILLSEGVRGGVFGRTGIALLRYSPAEIVAAISHDAIAQRVRIGRDGKQEVAVVSSVDEARALGAEVLVIGVAPYAGRLPLPLYEEVLRAVRGGMSIVSGLHTPLSTDPSVSALLDRERQWVWDIRHEPPIWKERGTSPRLACQRVLTVSTSSGVGKMTTALELALAAQARGMRAKFIGTSQAGVMISGTGITLDASRLENATCSVQQALADTAIDVDMIFVEGQGSLFHRSSSATLSLLQGVLPTHLVLVHRPESHAHYDQSMIPNFPTLIRLYEELGCCGRIFERPRVVGVALDSVDLSDEDVARELRRVEELTGLPCIDPLRVGADRLLDLVLETKVAQAAT